MKPNKILIFVIASICSLTACGQLFQPLGLDLGLGHRMGPNSVPQMHIENNKLFVCTNQGLYSKDLSNLNSVWYLEGFEGVPMQDYVRNGNDILALRYGVNGEFFLLSHDGGKTYQDVTPSLFVESGGAENELIKLVQHPNERNTLLVASSLMGILESSDFGQTWMPLTDIILGNGIGYNPSNPDIIYNCGWDDAFSPHLNISYDGGHTWEYLPLSFPGDNCVHQLTFNPSNPNHWIACGDGVVYISTDNGHTWETQNFWNDGKRNFRWYFATFDSDNSENVYLVGSLGELVIMCSTDGGKTWSIPKTETIHYANSCNVNDFQQYGDNLFVYTEADVYKISKSELLAKSSVQSVTAATIGTPSVYFDLLGRRASTSTRGIVVSRGRKYLIR